jgi:hypothetical protein
LTDYTHSGQSSKLDNGVVTSLTRIFELAWSKLEVGSRQEMYSSPWKGSNLKEGALHLWKSVKGKYTDFLVFSRWRGKSTYKRGELVVTIAVSYRWVAYLICVNHQFYSTRPILLDTLNTLSVSL